MDRLRAGYVIDPATQQALNRQGRNYWWAYIAEIVDRIGLTADPVPVSELTSRQSGFSVLFLGPMESEPPAVDTSALAEWVSQGGTLIASRPEGRDDLFGNQLAGRIAQSGDFDVSGEFHLKESEFTVGVHSPLRPESPLLAASDIRLVTPVSSTVLAESGGRAVVTARSLGSGWAFYFGFDLAQTFWVIQQGRPVDGDLDGDGYLRTGDAIVIGESDPMVGYTDELAQLLQNMIAVQPHPLIDQLPPSGQTIPDMVLFYGGDDEGDEGIQLPAAEFMHSRGLPYHLNCMHRDGRFGIDDEQVSHLLALGTELSLHYDFLNGFDHPVGFTQDDVRVQSEQYLDHFGRPPVCVNTHVLRWTGWWEAAKWMMDAGAQSSNLHIHMLSSSINPVNAVGFAFGTSFPYHYWTGCEAGNGRLDFLSLPITAYETGYIGEDQVDRTTLETAIALARHYRLIMNLFYHPVYIAQYPACREAIDLLLTILREQGVSVLHSAPDAVTKWWKARSETRIEDVRLSGDALSMRTSTPSPTGFVARIPLGAHSSVETDLPHRVIEVSGRRWLAVVVPPGEQEVQVRLTDSIPHPHPTA